MLGQSRFFMKEASAVGELPKDVVCHLSNFSPEYAGTFIDSLLFLGRYCRRVLGLDSFYVFPETAKNREWLARFDGEGLQYGFAPRNRIVSRQIRGLLNGYQPVIFHTHFLLYDLTAVSLKRRYYGEAKVIWHYHSRTGATCSQRLKNIIKLRFIFGRYGDRCIAVGDGVQQPLIQAGLLSDKSVLVHNAINATRFVANSAVRSSVRKSLGIRDEETVFLLLGWDPIIKGVDVFIRAASEASRDDCNHKRFIIIGRKETREFVAKCHDVSRLGPSLRVIEPIDDLSRLLHGIDVMVSASRSEGLPYSILESMASGKIILASDIPSVRETYARSRGTFLFRSEDWHTLGLLMNKTAELTTQERASLGQANRQYVLENHSLEGWVAQIGQVYRDLLDHSSNN